MKTQRGAYDTSGGSGVHTASRSESPSASPGSSPIGAVTLSVLSPEEFEMFRKYIYEVTGIRLSDRKVPMLSNRLRRRLRELGIQSFRDYYRYLKECGPNSKEFYHFLEVVTTNETYFFRNRDLWDRVEKSLLPALVKRRPAGEPLVLWSAACSSGEEPYTLAIIVHRNRLLFAGRQVRILASDISRAQLAHAQVALYESYAVEKMSERERRRYFKQEGDKYRLCDEVRGMVKFFFHNLKDRLRRGNVDCVLLRNVLMYFDDAMKRRALENVCAVLKPGGFLILGDVDHLRSQPEFMARLGVKHSQSWVYEKQS